MKFSTYFIAIVIILFGILTLITMIKDGMDSMIYYLIPVVFILCGGLMIFFTKYDDDIFK